MIDETALTAPPAASYMFRRRMQVSSIRSRQLQVTSLARGRLLPLSCADILPWTIAGRRVYQRRFNSSLLFSEAAHPSFL